MCYLFLCFRTTSNVLYCILSDLINAEHLLLDGPCCLLGGFIWFLPARLLNLFVYYESYVPDKYQHARVKFENVKLNPLTYWLWICIPLGFLSKYKTEHFLFVRCLYSFIQACGELLHICECAINMHFKAPNYFF